MANVTGKASRHAKSESKWAYIMVAPTVIGLLVLNIYPFLETIVMSFSKTRPFGLFELQGIENYVEMFTSAEFWRANLNTLYFCILTVPLGLFLSLVVAVMLNAKIKGRTFFRAVFFLPMVDVQHGVRHYQQPASCANQLDHRSQCGHGDLRYRGNLVGYRL